MESDASLDEKYKIILRGFLHENYKNKNNIYFEQLFSHLSGKGGDGEVCKTLLYSSTTVDWIDECIRIASENFNKLDDKVLTFMFKITALLTQNEWLLIQLRERKIADKIEMLVKANVNFLTPSVKLGYLYFLSSISKYSFGICIIKTQKIWTMVLRFCRENDTIYVKRKAMELLFDFFSKLSVKVKDEDTCTAIIHEIMIPFKENIYSDQSSSVLVNDMELQKKVSPAFDLLLYFLQNSFEPESKVDIAHYFEPSFETDTLIWKYINTFHDSEFVCKLLKIMTALNYARLSAQKSKNGKISEESFNQFGVNFYNYLKFCIMRRNCDFILQLVEFNRILWRKLGSEVPSEILIENETINFEIQLATIHLMPVLMFLKPSKADGCKEIIDDYVMKIFNTTNEFTQRVAYSIRDLLLDCPENAVAMACKAINGILSMLDSLNRPQAVLIFQAMTFALKSFIKDEYDEASHVPNGSQRKRYFSVVVREKSNIMFLLVVGLHAVVQKFKITWKDSIESLCLLTLVLNVLETTDLTTRVAVQLLKLAQLSIEHFMSPNMALLMNNYNETGMQHLQQIMFKRLHDNSWEVRDTTLELITIVVSISELKFPPFQQFVLDSGVCPIVFTMVQNDPESYIRASALKCLSEMTKINTLWDNCVNQMDLMKFCISYISKESEGIVRKEAVLLITKIFENRKQVTAEPNKLFSVMAYCAVNDFYWEVKINALKFWRAVICQQFTNQGMIDGTFPSVTFSKQHKKIVTLTEKEILLRIRKILDDMSKYGILGILLECLEDDCDFEVVKVAVELIQKILKCLNKYNFLESITFNENNNESGINVKNGGANSSTNSEIASKTPMSTDEPMDADYSETSNIVLPSENIETNKMDIADFNENDVANYNDVIESILDSNDFNLLASGYQNKYMNAESINGSDISKIIEENFHKKFIKITPEIFLSKVIKINLDTLIREKQKWISNTDSIDSLLDDMIYSIKALGVNDADCY